MKKTKILISKLQELVILANAQIAAGHYEAGGMVIQHALDRDFQDINTSIEEDEELLYLVREQLEEARTLAQVPEQTQAPTE